MREMCVGMREKGRTRLLLNSLEGSDCSGAIYEASYTLSHASHPPGARGRGISPGIAEGLGTGGVRRLALMFSREKLATAWLGERRELEREEARPSGPQLDSQAEHGASASLYQPLATIGVSQCDDCFLERVKECPEAAKSKRTPPTVGVPK
jgi:hypothetical protein